MKQLIIILLVATAFTACKKEGEVIKGNFLYYADAAVLQTETEVYGVIINKKMHELNDKVQSYKKETTDMIPVEIRAVVTPKPQNEEGWNYRVDIQEIINVFEPSEDENDVIKIEN